ncbi:unnamed protein product [Closterium sp. NIES-53]
MTQFLHQFPSFDSHLLILNNTTETPSSPSSSFPTATAAPPALRPGCYQGTIAATPTAAAAAAGAGSGDGCTAARANGAAGSGLVDHLLDCFNGARTTY